MRLIDEIRQKFARVFGQGPRTDERALLHDLTALTWSQAKHKGMRNHKRRLARKAKIARALVR